MRVWMPATPADIAALVHSGAMTLGTGFTITPEWAQLVGESDDEVLAELRALNVDGQIVVVADTAATVLEPDSGLVAVTQPISARQISAFLAKSEPGDEDFSWFGPTEGLNLLDFVG